MKKSISVTTLFVDIGSVLNDLDSFHLDQDVIKRLPKWKPKLIN